MSSPATSCSRRYTDNASTYCSRKREITIASRNDLMLRFSVYQLGRGSDPVIVVGRTLPAVAFIIVSPEGKRNQRSYHHQLRRGTASRPMMRDAVSSQKSIDALSFTNRDCSTDVGTS